MVGRCLICTKEFNYYEKHSKGKFCSWACYTKDAQQRTKAERIKHPSGYIVVLQPNHPKSFRSGGYTGYVLEHRLVMEQKVGRYLDSDEIVHHINGIRDDSRPENLAITNTSDHIAQHNRERVWKEESRKKHSEKARRLRRDTNGRFIT